MTQHQNTILNGPSGELTMAFKDARQLSSENMSKVPSNGTGVQPSLQGSLQPGGTNGSVAVRPPLARLDSRATLLQPQSQGAGQQPRSPYPPINLQGQGPPQFRSPLQQPQQQRTPFPQGGQPFVQRPPPPRINFPQQGGAQRPQQPPISPSPSPQPYVVRPQGGFPPRNQTPRVFLPQQQSLPGAAPASRPFYQAVLRARTLDSTSESQVTQEFTPRDDVTKTAAIAAMKNRSFSVANPEPSIVTVPQDVRRMSASSVGSNDAVDVARPANGKIITADLPPRPESRTGGAAAMTRIEERVATPEKMHTAPVVNQAKPELAEVKKLPMEPGCSLSKDDKPDVKGINLKSPAKSEGDNDSGVDESTQGNESNGERISPKKPTAIKSGRSTATPTKHRSVSRGGKSPNPLSPDSTPSTPGATEKKKLPMNKIQVGSAPSPNLKVVKSKIGSLQNATHKPGGGNVKIEHKKIDVSSTTSRIAAKNDTYVPGGGDKKIQQQKLQWNVKSKIGSLDNAQHKPKGGDKKIETVKLDFKDKAKPKVGSKDNMKHVAGGGDIKSETVIESPNVETVNQAIENKKIDLNVHSKIGSFENVKHKAGGGVKKIFDDKEYLRQMSGQEMQQSLSTSQNSIPSSSDPKEPVSDENLNREN